MSLILKHSPVAELSFPETSMTPAPKSVAVSVGGVITCVQFRCKFSHLLTASHTLRTGILACGGAALRVRSDFGLLLLVTSLGGAREVTDAHALHRVASHQTEHSTSRFFFTSLPTECITFRCISTQVIPTANDGRQFS